MITIFLISFPLESLHWFHTHLPLCFPHLPSILPACFMAMLLFTHSIGHLSGKASPTGCDLSRDNKEWRSKQCGSYSRTRQAAGEAHAIAKGRHVPGVLLGSWGNEGKIRDITRLQTLWALAGPGKNLVFNSQLERMAWWLWGADITLHTVRTDYRDLTRKTEETVIVQVRSRGGFGWCGIVEIVWAG